MENKKPNTILKAIVLVASWLTLSPLLLILDGRWKVLPKWLRVVLFVLSPMMLVLYFVLGIMVYFSYQDYWRKHHFVRPQVIENITGVKLPKYKVVERNLFNSSFDELNCEKRHRSRLEAWAFDHTDSFVLEFEETPDSTFFQTLRNYDFDYHDGCYSFQLNWGSGLVKDEVIPRGEKGNYDYSMTICEGDKRSPFGSWNCNISLFQNFELKWFWKNPYL